MRLQGNAYDVIDNHYARNRAPVPPDPRQLEEIRSWNGPDVSVASVEGRQHFKPSTDHEEKSRATRHSLKPYTGSTNDPKLFGFYPPQWRDVLERAQKLWRTWMALECGFPERETNLDMAMRCVTEALSEHQRNGGKTENGSDDLRHLNLM